MDFSWIIKVDRLITTKKHGDWCRIPYEGHKKGCPMYGTRDTCPPKAPFIKDHLDTSKPIYFVHSEFFLELDIERRRTMNPSQTERQLRCVLYWQGSSRKQMRDRVKFAMRRLAVDTIIEIPEAMGVNVYGTAHVNGLYLERIRNLKAGKGICKHVSLLGVKK